VVRKRRETVEKEVDRLYRVEVKGASRESGELLPLSSG
jgi:hypothetical protein